MRRALWGLPLTLSLATFACSDEPGPSDAGADTGSTDDAAAHDGEVSDAERPDAGHAEAYGFTLRVPVSRTVPCVGESGVCPNGTIEFPDRDYVCTLEYGTLSAFLYVQATPTQYIDFMGPVFSTVGAWLSDGVTAEPVTASYDWGGGHHNEAIVLDLPEQRIQYWHSSFGFGFRACHAPDCLDVYRPDSSDLVESGCSPERTLPVVCKAVREDGTLPELIDTFEKCPGDD